MLAGYLCLGAFALFCGAWLVTFCLDPEAYQKGAKR
jgi:hypothetical protein